MRCRLLLTFLLAMAAAPWGTLSAAPPPERLEILRRGVNLTNWFRYPGSLDPARLRDYLSDAAMRDLRQAGFGFVRLAVQPEMLLVGDRPDPVRLRLLLTAIRRLQAQGLGVVIGPHPYSWKLESEPTRLIRFWRSLAPALAGSDPGLTFPEIVNVPVFHQNATGWSALQAAVLTELRATLPAHTIILTGPDWGSLGGLLALPPVLDPNIVYSFHFYDPVELTSLAAYRPGLDTKALARLPFPMNPIACAPAIAGTADPDTEGLMRFVCAMGWNPDRVRQAFAAAADWARRNHAALLLGEFGATVRLNAPARLSWLTSVREAAEQAGIGWALWGYEDEMGLNLPRPPPARPILDAVLLRALGLPARSR